MKRNFVVYLVVLLFFSFAQHETANAQESSLLRTLFPNINTQTVIKPVPKIIENSKNSGAVFQTREFFERNASSIANDSDLTSTVKEGVVFDLDNAAIKSFLAKSPEFLTLQVPGKNGGFIELELAKVNIFAPGFKVTNSNGKTENVEKSYGVHYRGIIKGDMQSLASVSVFETEVMGIFSTVGSGNMVLGRLGGVNPENRHILYNDKDLTVRPNFNCDVETPNGVELPEAPPQTEEEFIARCVRIYVEANYNLFVNKGSVANTISYVAGFFNQSATLIANTGVSVTLSEVYVWTSPSPYTGTDTSTQLELFRTNRQTFNGNLAHLVDLQNIGGRAYLNAYCNGAFRHGYSGIFSNYSNVPTYSFTVQIFAHETGHNLGSPHTHACAWNGNNTAIDGCFTVEGTCANPGLPSGGGTIMSYCYNTSAGVNFNLGYGPQPSSLILSRFNAATCLTDCGTTPCNATPIAANQTVSGNLSATDCLDSTTGRNFDAYTFSGTAGQQISVTQTSTAFDTYLYLVNSSGQIVAQDDDGGGGTNSRIPATSGFFTLPASGTYTIRASAYDTNVSGAYTLNLTVNGGCPTVPISPGQTISGSLTTADCVFTGTTRYVDIYTISGTAGQRIAVGMNSAAFDTYLYLVSPGSQTIAEDDDGGGGTNSRIPATSGFLTLPTTGTYQIYATAYSADLTGAYTITLANESAPCTYSATPSVQNFAASGGSGTISVSTQAGCGWSAGSNSSWLTITGGSSGTGSNPVTFSVAANGGAARTGTLTVAGQTVTVNQAGVSTPTTIGKHFDFDGDRKTDIGIFRPSNGQWWHLRSSDNNSRAAQFGTSTDILVPADYTGDGRVDVAFWRPSTGQWFIIRSEDNSFYAFPFGQAGDIPAPGDFDRDGRADAAVYRPSTGAWYILLANGTVISQSFGIPEDKPVVADYDGDGKDDIAVFRPSSAQWWILRSSTNSVYAAQFGASGDKTVQGDYTGDGKADIAFFRPSNGFWYILRSEDSSFYGFPFGTSGDQPTPGDYDGDSKFDAAVFRSSNLAFYLQRTTAGFLAVGFGINGDQPIAACYVR